MWTVLTVCRRTVVLASSQHRRLTPTPPDVGLKDNESIETLAGGVLRGARAVFEAERRPSLPAEGHDEPPTGQDLL
jgi:hypothetical protein